jgi:hypothetical protein
VTGLGLTIINNMHQITITFNEETGDINVNGPVNNKGLCYLMLECARDAVKDSVDNMQQQQRIVPAEPNGLPPFVRNTIRKKR